MSYSQSIITDARNNIIRIDHPELPSSPRTELTDASPALSLTLSVSGNSGFSNGDYLVLGENESDPTEIAVVSGAVTDGTSLTVNATVYDHPAGTSVRKTLWNQVEISGSATVSGTKTVIATVGITYSETDTEYVNAGVTYAYYFARFKNSVSGVFSSYSDASPASGYDSDTVRKIKETALNMTGQSIGEIITDDFLNTEIVNLENSLFNLGPGKRWAHLLVNDHSLGTLDAGVTKYAMPTDIADSDTAEAIQEIHTKQIIKLDKIEKSTVEKIRWNLSLSTLSTQALIGDITVVLDDVGDFEDSGSFALGEDTVTYTARDTTTNTLSGIPASGTGSITENSVVGTNVWQGGQVSMSPTSYFVHPGYVELPLPPSSTHWGNNLWCSYYSKPVYPDSDADKVNFPDVSVYHSYLAWKIQLRLSSGMANETNSGLMMLHESQKAGLISRARLQDQPRFVPRRSPNRNQNYFSSGIVYYEIA